VGTAAELDHVRVFMMLALRRIGDFPALTDRMHEYVRDAHRRGDRYAATSMVWSCNLVWLAADSPARAEAELDSEDWVSADASLHLQHWFRARSQFELALYRGDPVAIASAVATITPCLGPSFAHVEVVQTETRYFLARAAIQHGDAATAQAVMAPLARARRPHTRAFVRLIDAAVAAIGGDLSRARARLADALADAEVSEMRAIAALIRRRRAILDRDDATVAACDDDLAACGVRNPAAFARVFVTWPA
jgi:hypothetical protein